MDPKTYPPPLDADYKSHLLSTIQDWSIANGLAVRPAPANISSKSQDGSGADKLSGNVFATTAPVTLFPSLFPRSCFEEALALQTTYNELYAAVARDEEWLEGIVKELTGIDDFIAKLWDVHVKVKKEGYVQPITLGIFRSDYMCHTTHTSNPGDSDTTAPIIKQVEFNTIASSFAGLASKTSSLHRFLKDTNIYADILGTSLDSRNLPPNPSISTVSSGLAAAHRAYAPSNPSNYTCVLFIVQEGERNIFDQRHIEYDLFNTYGIQSFRVSLQRVQHETYLSDNDGCTRVLMFAAYGKPASERNAAYEVSTVYYRAGYSPAEYTGEEEWRARWQLERSAAIKCPSVLTHLAGCKKVQQVLARPEDSLQVLERFLPNWDRDNKSNDNENASSDNDSNNKEKKQARHRLHRTFVPMYPLDGHSAAGMQGRRLALDPETAARHVLKPQREGGGNNVYREAIPPFLRGLPEEQWAAYILMEMIEPAAARNVVLRGGRDVSEGGVISELGCFGYCLWRLGGRERKGMDRRGEMLENRGAGYLLRTKGDQSEEGGVAAGFGAIDSCYLI